MADEFAIIRLMGGLVEGCWLYPTETEARAMLDPGESVVSLRDCENTDAFFIGVVLTEERFVVAPYAFSTASAAKQHAQSIADAASSGGIASCVGISNRRGYEATIRSAAEMSGGDPEGVIVRQFSQTEDDSVTLH